MLKYGQKTREGVGGLGGPWLKEEKLQGGLQMKNTRTQTPSVLVKMSVLVKSHL